MKTPTEITVHSASRVLELAYEGGRRFRLPFEFLRVYSPSAEVRGHGPGQETLQVGKRDVLITGVEPVGHYAIKPVFSDGHDSGIFAWDYLYELAENYEGLWAEYLAQLEAAGASRDPEDPRNAPLIAAARAKGSCATH
ncbi:MAG: gamma-butyrobetaine hydroxylase-like domain-containing protein [Betaproteobacteria bacterium]